MANSVVALGLLVAMGCSSAGSGRGAPGTVDTTFGGTGTVQLSIANSQTTFDSVTAVGSSAIAAAGGTNQGLSTGSWLVAEFALDGSLKWSITSFSPALAAATSIAALPDGHLYVAGWTASAGATGQIVRLNPDGSADNTFAGGVVVAGATDNLAHGPYLAIQPDGNIVYATNTRDGNGEDTHLFRYTAAGAPDSSFGSGGSFTLPHYEIGGAPVVQADGSIVFAAYTTAAGAVFRLQPSGQPDPTFGTGGLVHAPCPSCRYSAVALASDLTIVAFGLQSQGGGGATYLISRLNPSGSPAVFGSAGNAYFTDSMYYLTSPDEGDRTGLVDGSNRPITSVLVSGTATFPGLVRVSASGGSDPGFAEGGVLSAPVTLLAPWGIALQPDSRVVGVGTVGGLGLGTATLYRIWD